MSTILPAHRLPRRRRYAAASGAVALFLASVVAVSWPGPASATGSGSGGGQPLVEIVKTTFSSMGVLFLGIAVYEGYRIPRPA